MVGRILFAHSRRRIAIFAINKLLPAVKSHSSFCKGRWSVQAYVANVIAAVDAATPGSYTEVTGTGFSDSVLIDQITGERSRRAIVKQNKHYERGAASEFPAL